MRPINRGLPPLDDQGKITTYSNYRLARRDLIDKLGPYCSYCERKISASLAVEHVVPKVHHPGGLLKWSNFLLACVNCNSTKGHEDINIDDYLWPDTHNTHVAFNYLSSGFLAPKVQLPAPYKVRAKKTISLVGLNVKNITPLASDTRWENRIEAWNIAKEELKDFEASPQTITEVNGIVRIAQGYGFWSVWMKVFEHYPLVQDHLILAFPGTFVQCRTTDINRN
jgi:uncharacterized protein (TIGR02646 family)